MGTIQREASSGQCWQVRRPSDVIPEGRELEATVIGQHEEHIPQLWGFGCGSYDHNRDAAKQQAFHHVCHRGLVHARRDTKIKLLTKTRLL